MLSNRDRFQRIEGDDECYAGAEHFSGGVGGSYVGDQREISFFATRIYNFLHPAIHGLSLSDAEPSVAGL